MFPHLKGFNLQQWIDENRGNWGQRRVIWENSDFIAFVTRGPNRRKDFHINPGDEIFYQLEGELNLHYLGKDGKAGTRSFEGRGLVSFTGQCSPFAAARRWVVDLRCRENTPSEGTGPFHLDLRRMRQHIARDHRPLQRTFRRGRNSDSCYKGRPQARHL